MIIEIKDKEYELDLGIEFAETLDKKYKLVQSISTMDLEFGMGVGMVAAKLDMVSIGAIIEFFEAGLKGVKRNSYSKADLNKAIENKAKELGGFAQLADACVEALVEVGLYSHVFEADPEQLKQTLEQIQEDE